MDDIQALLDREAAIRRHERARLANLIEEHADSLTAFTKDDSQTIRLIIWLLRLGAENIEDELAQYDGSPDA